MLTRKTLPETLPGCGCGGLRHRRERPEGPAHPARAPAFQREMGASGRVCPHGRVSGGGRQARAPRGSRPARCVPGAALHLRQGGPRSARTRGERRLLCLGQAPGAPPAGGDRCPECGLVSGRRGPHASLRSRPDPGDGARASRPRFATSPWVSNCSRRSSR